MDAEKNLAVALYFAAGLGSILLCLLLSVMPHAAASIFPQPGSEEALAWVRTIYR